MFGLKLKGFTPSIAFALLILSKSTSTKHSTKKKQFGLIAQDVETIYPNLVYKDEDTKKLSLNYMGFIAVIIQSIKEIHKSFGNDVSDLRLQDKALELKDKKLKDDLELLKNRLKFLRE